MNKKQLIEAIAKRADLKDREARDCLNAFLEAISTSLTKGQSVTLVGFGSFLVSQRNARLGRNPQTGLALEIPAKRVPVFKAGKDLKSAVN